jgi:L-serine dehydratase
MALSIFDLYTIGVGPSSSHTVGPMRAAKDYVETLKKENLLDKVITLKIELFGSLALTGKGHGTHKAIIAGLNGESPESVNPDDIPLLLDKAVNQNEINLSGEKKIFFNMKNDFLFKRKEFLDFHSNGMRFSTVDQDEKELYSEIYYSTGGGFILTEAQSKKAATNGKKEEKEIPFPYNTVSHFLKKGREKGLTSLAQMILENEKQWRSEVDIYKKLDHIWLVMQDVVQRGCRQEGILPGGLNVIRRAPELFGKLFKHALKGPARDPFEIMDWVNLYALAVNEENAAGGRIVTAPTNGAAGIIPAVLHYYSNFDPKASQDGVRKFLLTAGGIGIFYKLHASISGAEVGCQGEVGVACSMAAGALADVMGGSLAQIENAAEIGMEHNLGLTCDPIGGLVQIPCIERNAMASVKAINAARIALRGDGKHFVSLDKVMKTMMKTGEDMKEQYKETSLGGLAVNVIEC